MAPSLPDIRPGASGRAIRAALAARLANHPPGRERTRPVCRRGRDDPAKGKGKGKGLGWGGHAAARAPRGEGALNI